MSKWQKIMRIKHVSYFSWLLTVFIVVFSNACFSKTNHSEKLLNEHAGYRLLSKSEAEQYIIVDKKEAFFDKVTSLEMSIQMKKSMGDMSRKDILKQYKKTIQNDLSEFTKEESEMMKKTFEKALDLSYKINPKLNLPEIFLIKTKGKYYGDSTFFTRDNSIVIPSFMLKVSRGTNSRQFLSVMIHEIFHIYSRYNQKKREALYQRIGFEKLSNLSLSKFLKERVLYNPDGVDLDYAINVKDIKTNREFKAIPAIFSKHKNYRSDILHFFGYVEFQLFEIQKHNGAWIVADKDGYSVDDVIGFWEQVGRNTQYNIHPDEICADNFVLLAFSKENNAKNLKSLSKEGRQLVKDLEKIILEK